MKKTIFYRKWTDMVSRCNNKNNSRFEDWGGRGIKVDKKWLCFLGFKNDMYESYLDHVEKFGEKETQLDRINNNKGYSKKNCKWSTIIEQASNKRNNRFITLNNETKTLSQWSRKTGINITTIYMRLYRYGWSIEEALNLRK